MKNIVNRGKVEIQIIVSDSFSSANQLLDDTRTIREGHNDRFMHILLL
jgi:hypothetical protein